MTTLFRQWLAACVGIAASLSPLPSFAAAAIVAISFTSGAEFGVPPPRLVRIGRLDMETGKPEMAPCPEGCLGGSPLFYGGIARSDRNGIYVLLNDPGRRLRRISASTGAILDSVPLPVSSFTMTRLPFEDVFVSGAWEGMSVHWDDGGTLQRIGSVAVASTDVVSSIASSADGAQIFVVAGERLVMIDARSRSVLASRNVGFDFSPVVDRLTGRVYGVDRQRNRVLGFDPSTLDVVVDLPVTEDNDGDASGGLAVDFRGQLWIEVDSNAGARRVTILDPAIGIQVGDLVLKGRGFVPGYRSDRILRYGPDLACVAGPYSCGGDALFEYDADFRNLLRTTPLEFRTPAELQSVSRVVLMWVAFLPDAGTAVEFYHAGLDHYFLSVDSEEIAALDRGAFTGWQRTGQSFGVLRSDSGPESYVPVCRYYGRPDRGLDSHFYSASPEECIGLAALYDGSWIHEHRDAFYAAAAEATSGACPNGTIPVYRLWNARFDSSHRYTTSAVIKAQMIERGYVPEGSGPEKVAFCARS